MYSAIFPKVSLGSLSQVCFIGFLAPCRRCCHRSAAPKQAWNQSASQGLILALACAIFRTNFFQTFSCYLSEVQRQFAGDKKWCCPNP